MSAPASPYAIRLATLADAPAMQAIYAPYVTETVISFEYEAPTIAEFAERVRKVQEKLPWLVAEHLGEIIGYAYASSHRERAAYQWATDTSVYVLAAHHGAGVARQLYTQLLHLLRQQGYVQAYAGITLPNPRSEAFHRAFGFELVGTYRQVGYKFGGWHDVQWLACALQVPPAAPAPPGPVPPLG